MTCDTDKTGRNKNLQEPQFLKIFFRPVRMKNVSIPLLRKEGSGVVDNQGYRRGDNRPDITIEPLNINHPQPLLSKEGGD